VTGKDEPRRARLHKAWQESTQPHEEIRATDAVAFFRSLGETAAEGKSPRYRSVRTREILDNCYYTHVTREVPRARGLRAPRKEE